MGHASDEEAAEVAEEPAPAAEPSCLGASCGERDCLGRGRPAYRRSGTKVRCKRAFYPVALAATSDADLSAAVATSEEAVPAVPELVPLDLESDEGLPDLVPDHYPPDDDKMPALAAAEESGDENPALQ